MQIGEIVSVNGEKIPADANFFDTNKAVNLIVYDFQQLVFKDPENGNSLKYNLYVPKNYDLAKSHPLVLFMHDAGVTGDETDCTLLQGLGAVVLGVAGGSGKAPGTGACALVQYPNRLRRFHNSEHHRHHFTAW